MGDPECQVILPRLKTDLVTILNAALANKLNKIKIVWNKSKCMTIVICSKGYPNKYKINKIIDLKKINLNKKTFLFHAGTIFKNNSLVSNGGRVLSIVVLGDTFAKIRIKILEVIKKINWKYGFFRKDIGWKVIKSK
jgi:phosphoribosylamine--glycine ligase